MIAALVAPLVRLLAGVHVQQDLAIPEQVRIYIANHSSHLDFVVIWAVLPPALRVRCRPVAAADYWSRGLVRKRLATDLFRAVLVPREDISRQNNPLDLMISALGNNQDLILFPEGTRSADGTVHPFRPGLFHLVRRFPAAEILPVNLENLSRILPKGEFLPVPILGRVTFGSPMTPLGKDETKAAFLERCRKGVEALGSPV